MNEIISKNEELKNSLESTISNLKENFEGEIKVSLYDINKGLEADVDGNKIGWAASIIKVPIMITTLQEIEKGNLSLLSQLKVDHKYTLEPYDYTSKLADGSFIPTYKLLYHMMVESDNEAANILANEIGIENINKSVQDLGLEKTMLGHLLCPRAERYMSQFNLDGSNITCPNDMVTLMRHIYDRKFSKLESGVRLASDWILSHTFPSYLRKGKFEHKNIKAKVGYISDPEDGKDIHEVGIIDDNFIVCVMLNKVKQNSSGIIDLYDYGSGITNVYEKWKFFERCVSRGLILEDDSRFFETVKTNETKKYVSSDKVFDKIMTAIGNYVD